MTSNLIKNVLGWIKANGIEVYAAYTFVSFFMFGIPLFLYYFNFGIIGILWIIFFTGPGYYYLLDQMQ